MLNVALLLACSYLIGSIPFGVIAGRIGGFDPRKVGSGNIGMANVARAGGTGAAAATFVGDMLKGAIPVVFARVAGFDAPVVAGVALAAFVGSICSVFLGFRGGKGISAACGIWLVLSPLALGCALIAFAIVFGVFRIMSLSSMAAAVVLPPTIAALGLPRPYLLLAIVMAALVLLRHHQNIRRLVTGQEPTFKPKRSGSSVA
ncbi:MAG TPA: glycerol-3-phosphate 1-O-acyltransferase PlsY [Candidatus Binataceae bacterium]|nr:glycerol-3-phosphate 1-O-acyltransferase PlsY [Candidatus Binataceae bacterium]